MEIDAEMDLRSEIYVTINRGQEDEQQHTFSNSFKIGRGSTCEVQIQSPVVSAHHVEILFENDQWWLHDLHSTNGTFFDGELIYKAPLSDRATIQLGKDGPIVSFKIKSHDPNQRALLQRSLFGTMISSLPTATQMLQHYFSSSLPKSAGQYTIYLRTALNQALRKRSKKFLILIACVTAVAIMALGYAWQQQQRLARLEPLGIDIFYTMKALELQIARLSDRLQNSTNDTLVQEVGAMRKKYLSLQKEYDNYIDQLGVYDESVDETERLILRVARTFGECEINAPKDFLAEVQSFVKKWQSSNRLEIAIARSLAYNYHESIAEEFLANQLPPQFLYLALQESDFDVSRSGPKTRYGIAKGMWQFIPRTAAAYGLKVGPLRNYRRVDPRDERHDFEKSTKAAARFVYDLYKTKAQGSGMLVLASYNWGIGNLQRAIEMMPANPKERNFWNLVRLKKIPRETYDFVLYIVSAAVIGENPGLFGFEFKNLLEEIS